MSVESDVDAKPKVMARDGNPEGELDAKEVVMKEPALISMASGNDGALLPCAMKDWLL